jgi:hypothetical protein
LAQPLGRGVVPATNVEQLMRPCTDLQALGAAANEVYERKEREDCAGECLKLTAGVVERIRTYFSRTLTTRKIGLAAGIMIGGFVTWGFVFMAERRRSLGFRTLLGWRALGALVAFGIAAGVGYNGSRSVAPGFIAADHDLREMTRLGVIPRSSQIANAHCSIQLEQLTQSTDSPVWPSMKGYRGLFTLFEPEFDITPGSPATRTEISDRVADMVRVLETNNVEVALKPRTVSGVFARNAMLREARASWDTIGFLRWWWLPAVIAAFGALLLHWIALWTTTYLERRRIAQIVRGEHATIPNPGHA